MENKHLDMINHVFKCSQKASLTHKTEQLLVFQRANSLSTSPSKWKFHPSTNGHNESNDETKVPTNIKEVKECFGIFMSI